MTDHRTVNISASVHQRLMNLSQKSGREFNQLMTMFALERLLYRLTQSPAAGRFILKGALLFVVWQVPIHRPTRDLDLLGFGDSSTDSITQLFQSICKQAVVADGLDFDPDSVHVHAIREDQEYNGQRVELLARLGKARVPIQIDIGFGDPVSPAPVELDYPTLLEFPSPHLRTYAKETVIAEKLHAMVEFDLSNSRMKDFFDIWTMARLFSFDGITLAQSIQTTFAQRNRTISPTIPTALTAEFAENPSKRVQWQAFLNRNRLEVGSASFAQIIAELGIFLLPPWQALAEQRAFRATWPVHGPWTPE